MFIGVFCYINVHCFSWYDSVEFFMQSVFNKRLDSSRGYLWGVSLGALDFVQIFVGAGPGRLPTMERYSTGSFHSSYIQMIMQNGLAGLLLLYLIFWEFWKHLIVFCYKKGIRFVLACFIGIVIYKLF